ncbi:MAG: hypothetical protein AAGA48_06860 [Myxococcota bacterium]
MQLRLMAGLGVALLVLVGGAYLATRTNAPAPPPVKPAPSSVVASPTAPEAPAAAPRPTPSDVPNQAPEADIPPGLKPLLKGNPAAGEWAERVPDEFSEYGFGPTIEDILDECDLPHEIIDVQCVEPPCMVAWVAPLDADHPTSCPEWSVRFGSRSLTSVKFDVECPDGREVRAELATPQRALLESVADPHAWSGHRMARRATAYTVADWCE